MQEEARKKMIDLLRGFSALAVALFHFNEGYAKLPDLYHRGVKWGWLGVSVFFVVSGFCIAATRRKEGLIAFWFRRLARIFPPYWASVLLVLCVVALRIATTGINDVAVLPKDVNGWIYTAAALTSPASPVIGLSWVYWSLGYELAFYMVMGFFAVRHSTLLLILFSLLALFVPGYPLDRWGLFGLGVACYHYTQREYRAAVLVGALCFLSSFVQMGFLQAAVAVGAALLILYPPRWILKSVFDPFRAVGLFSYSLYLIHVSIGCYLLPAYLPFKLSRQLWPSLLQDLILLCGCLLSAYIFHILIEKPSHGFARRVRFKLSNRIMQPTA